MEQVKTAFVITSIISGYLLFLNRTFSSDLIINRVGDNYKVNLGKRFIGILDNPYCVVQRGVFYDTIIFRDNKIRTFMSIRNVYMF